MFEFCVPIFTDTIFLFEPISEAPDENQRIQYNVCREMCAKNFKLI